MNPVQTNSRKPWQKSENAPNRIRGRALLARNARIKLRDGYKCANCGRIANDHDVDHKVPLHHGGKDEDTNCQLLCTGTGRCHEQKSAKERGQRERVGCDTKGYPLPTMLHTHNEILNNLKVLNKVTR